MRPFKKLSNSIGSILLKSKLKNIVRKPNLVNLNNAKSIGIIFDADNANDLRYVSAFVKFLSTKNINIEILGFLNEEKRDDSFIGDETHNYFCHGDFNWFYKLKNQDVNEFIDKKFDVLIQVYPKDLLPVKYVYSLSNANFKVSQSGIDDVNFDLMMDVNKTDHDLKYVLEQMWYYLSMLSQNK